MASKKLSDRKRWEQKFIEKAGTVHKRSLPRFAARMLKRTSSWKGGLTSRSKKKGVECTITLEEFNNLVMDHILPISKGGNSNKDNLHVICKTSNSMKGSLEEKNFYLLLEWLDTVSPELKKDVSIRLSGGIY